MLTRSYLKSIGIEGDKIDSIVEAHGDTVEGLKGKIAELQTMVDNLKTAEASLNQTKADLDKANKTIASMKEKATSSDELMQERDSLKTTVADLQSQIEQFTTKQSESETELNGLREQLATITAEKDAATAEAQTAKDDFAAFRTKVETEQANAVKREAVITALRNGGVNRPDFQSLIVGSVDMDSIVIEDGVVKDVDTFIENTKAKYPSCFGTIEEGGTPHIDPVGGNPPRPLTLAKIKAMSAEEINANWAEVQKTLSKGE